MRHSRGAVVALAVLVFIAGVSIAAARAAGAAANSWPHWATGGFSTPAGDGFWETYGDGSVAHVGQAASYGDARNINLNGPVVGGAATSDGKGYWLVAWDGGMFSFGD